MILPAKDSSPGHHAQAKNIPQKHTIIYYYFVNTYKGSRRARHCVALASLFLLQFFGGLAGL